MRRIKQISVTNLFGMFNHTIPLNMDERITIIHGPNGFGKTIILRLLNELFSQRISALRTIPFEEFRVDFDDGSSFWVVKALRSLHEHNEQERSSTQITFHATGLNSKAGLLTFTLKPTSPSSRGLTASMIDRMIPEIDRIALEAWRLLPTGEVLSFEDVVERFSNRLPIEIAGEKEPDWLVKMRKDIPVRFIETQRLLNQRKASKRSEYDRHPTMVPTVTMYSEELADTIKTKLAESTALSQSLDGTFPARVVNPTARRRSIAESELRNKLAELERKRSGLAAAGLLDQDNDTVGIQVNEQIDESTKVVLSFYVEDVEKKLEVFDEIAKKIDLLKRLINKRFLYKEIAISRKDGFVFTTSDGIALSPTDLSSGEQHELVLFYELLFKVDPGSLILIDEPELSLHVAWQMEFLKDLQEITQLANLDVLIATHSPEIINERWDLTVRLEGPSK